LAITPSSSRGLPPRFVPVFLVVDRTGERACLQRRCRQRRAAPRADAVSGLVHSGGANRTHRRRWCPQIGGEALGMTDARARRVMCSSTFVDSDDLSVDHSLARLNPPPSRGDRRVRLRQIFVIPRPNLQTLSVLHEQRTVAVELDLVGPLVAFRELIDHASRHRLHEPRRVALVER
jgi:hypothetical protein